VIPHSDTINTLKTNCNETRTKGEQQQNIREKERKLHPKKRGGGGGNRTRE